MALVRTPRCVTFLVRVRASLEVTVETLDSQEYIRNIQYVDDIVRKVEQEMNSFYQDERTAYVFT